MDVNTIIVVVIDGGLVIFFLYALYTVQSINLSASGLKKDLKISAQGPVFARLQRSIEEELETRESITQEVYDLEQAEPSPMEHGMLDYEAEPVETTPKEYGLPEFELEPPYVQAQEDELPKMRKHEREKES